MHNHSEGMHQREEDKHTQWEEVHNQLEDMHQQEEDKHTQQEEELMQQSLLKEHKNMRMGLTQWRELERWQGRKKRKKRKILLRLSSNVRGVFLSSSLEAQRPACLAPCL